MVISAPHPNHPLYREGPLGPDKVAVAGDWHGNRNHARHAIKWARQQGATVLVHCGDFGYWRDIPDTADYLGVVHAALEEHDMILAWVDGNHEDFDRIAELHDPRAEHPFPGKVTDRIWHLPRGYRWQWHGKTWMSLGGASSVDRQHRMPYRDWWPGELLSHGDYVYATRPGPVHIMVCHDVPDGARVPAIERKTSNWIPEEDLRLSQRHREIIRRVVDQVKPAMLFHGHYHCRYSDLLERRDGRTLVLGLDMDGGPMRDNMEILVLNPPKVWTGEETA